MIPIFAFAVCMVVVLLLLVAAIVIKWRDNNRKVIWPTEQEAAEQRAREAGREDQGGQS